MSPFQKLYTSGQLIYPAWKEALAHIAKREKHHWENVWWYLDDTWGGIKAFGLVLYSLLALILSPFLKVIGYIAGPLICLVCIQDPRRWERAVQSIKDREAAKQPCQEHHDNINKETV